VAGGPRAPAPAPKARFSTKWLAAHRRRLKFSAGDYALLLGVCGHSVYLWERGEAKPRQEQVARFHAIRGLKRREALARLEILRVAAAARKPAARGGRRRGGRGVEGKAGGGRDNQLVWLPAPVPATRDRGPTRPCRKERAKIDNLAQDES